MAAPPALGKLLEELDVFEHELEEEAEVERSVSTRRGNSPELALLRPLEALRMSRATGAGSRPCATTIASAVATSAVADSMLLASFIAWAGPGAAPT